MTLTDISLNDGIEKMVAQGYDEELIFEAFQRWVTRGDVVLIFENHDLGHRYVGAVIAMPWTPKTDGPIPPYAPDNALGLGWRFLTKYIINPEGHEL